MTFDGGSITSVSIPPCGTAPRHPLFATPEPDQAAFLPHTIQAPGDGGALDLDVISQLPGGDFLEMNASAGPFGVHFSVTFLQAVI